jgi:4-amino-4-deoxy-L-arabinose transferase-like glycosyltransferase
MPVSRRWLYGILLACFTVLWFSNLQYRHLINPDEGRYAEIPREMLTTGNWVTPRLNGLKYFEKPALQYWATAVAYKLFGEHEWTARLWTALTGYLGVLLAFYAGRRVFGETAGFYSAVALGSSVLYVAIGHVNAIDMGLTFFMHLSLAGFLVAQSTTDGRVTRRWMLVAWAAMALAVLSKGLIGIVLPGAVFVLYSLIQRDLQLWKRLHIGWGPLVFLAISGPWFVAVSLANPEFFQFFFIHEHFTRFLTKEHRRFHPWYTFIPLVLLGILPWVMTLFQALFRGWRVETGNKPFNAHRFVLIWAVFIFVFFSISDSKLPGYILPVFPALAWLIGDYLAQVRGRGFAMQTVALLAISIVAVIGIVHYYPTFADEPALVAPYAAYAVWLIAAAVVWFAGLAVAMLLGFRDRTQGAILSLAAFALIATQLVISGHETLAVYRSGYDVAQQIKPYLKPETPVYCLKMYDQSLPFYLKRTCTLVEYQDEMALGIEQEPEKWIPSEATFLANWARYRGAVVVMRPDKYRTLEAKKMPMRLLGQDSQRVAVAVE